MLTQRGADDANQTTNDESSGLESPVFVDSGSFGNDIVAILNNDNLNQHEIYRFDLIGDVYYRLSEDMLSGGKVAYMVISPDGRKLAYLADQEKINKSYLYLSNSDGSSNVRIHDYGSSYEEAEARDVKWSPDSTKMFYQIQKGDYYDGYEYSSFVVSIDDLGSPVEIPYSSNWVWSADGERLVSVEQSEEIITVRQLDVLNGFAEATPVIINNYDSIESYELDRKANKLLIHSVGESELEGLYIYDLLTQATTMIAEGAQFFQVGWGANGEHVAYWMSENTPVSGSLLFDLYLYDVENKLTVQVSHTDEREIVTASGFQWFNDESSVFYMANLSSGDDVSLYRTSIETLETVDVIDLLGVDSDIDSFRLLKNEAWMNLVMSNDDEYFYSTVDDSLVDLSDKQDSLSGLLFSTWVPDIEYAIFKKTGDRIAYLNMATGDVSALTLPEGRTVTWLCITVTAGEECGKIFDYR
jgi:hypothetical protein